MTTQVFLEITENRRVSNGTYKMTMRGDVSSVTAPGQFINIRLDGFFLRRPISISECIGDELTIFYKVVGAGTEVMAEMPVGTVLDVLCGLGNGFDTAKSGERPLLIGGGIGSAPMQQLARELIALGKKPTAVLGFATADDICLEEEIKALGADVVIATADGTKGVKGFVTHAMEGLDYDFFYACGPMPMLEAVEKVAKTDGQYSFEERMGCGFGACMGCSCETKYGSKRICRDGPVLDREEVKW